MSKSSKRRQWIFRYFSNRGSDYYRCFEFKRPVSPSDALEEAKAWAFRSTEGTACQEYTVQCFPVNVPMRREWLKQWNAICKRKAAIEKKYQVLRAMGMIQKKEIA